MNAIGKLEKVEEFKSTRHPEYGMSLKFQFKVLEGQFKNSFITGLVTSSWRPGNRLDKWLSALGVNTCLGDEVDTGKLIGRICLINVQNKKTAQHTFTYVGAIMKYLDNFQLLKAVHEKVITQKQAKDCLNE